MQNKEIYTHYCQDVFRGIDSTLKERIENKLRELEGRNDLRGVGSISNFNPIYIYKISTQYSRVVLQEEEEEVEVNNEKKVVTVRYVREIIAGKGMDYRWSSVHHKQLVSGTWLTERPLDESERTAAKNEIKGTTQTIESKPIPEEYANWLRTFKIELEDLDVFEYEIWLPYSLSLDKEKGLKDKDLNSFRELLVNIVDGNIDDKEFYSNNGHTIYEAQSTIDSDIVLLYAKSSKGTLVLAGANKSSQQSYWESVCKKLRETISDTELVSKLDNFQKAAKRAYPSWVLLDSERWETIQRNKAVSNLSLLDEQINFLENFSFPRYINGQAGSGKSTILYYIFARLSTLYEDKRIDGDILFLTENEELLKRSKDDIYKLLENNSSFNDENKVKQLDKFDAFFLSYQDFLLSFLHKDEKSKFQKNKYLNFSRFKALYNKQSKRRKKLKKYTPEEVWFVLQSYLIGYGNEPIAGSDYENEVSKKSRKITPARVKEIDEDVRSFYEELVSDEVGEQGKYWDKMKLIRHLKKSSSSLRLQTYDAIVCDEAQDFSKQELKFILERLTFFKYNEFKELNSAPIVFAGDANQTVNPTSFRKDELESIIYDILHDNGCKPQVYNEKVLRYNYRSSSQVVALANAVQFLRYEYQKLSNNEVYAQEAKNIVDEATTINLFFSKNKLLEKKYEDGLKKLRYKVFILPHDSEDEVLEAESQDPFLSSFKDDKGKMNLQTSVQAKGAEYPQVILYNFGQYFLDNFKGNSLNTNTLRDWKDSDETLYFKSNYFFNKFYVAVTRAQNELVIIDSEEAKEKFWKPLTQIVENEKYIEWSKASTASKNSKKLIELEASSLGSVIDSSPEDAQKNAQYDLDEGKFSKDPSRLRIAARQFLRLGKKDKYNLALAKAEEFSESWLEAAAYYEAASELAEASKAYLFGENFDKVLQLTAGSKDKISMLSRYLVKIYKAEPLSSEEVEKLKDNKGDVEGLVNNLPWREKFLDIILKFVREKDFEEQAKAILPVVRDIVGKEGNENFWASLAQAYFKQEEYSKAIAAWNEIDEVSHKDYFKAQIEASDKVEMRFIWEFELFKVLDNKQEESELLKKLLQSIKDNEWSSKLAIMNPEEEQDIAEAVYAVCLISDYFNTLNKEVIAKIDKTVREKKTFYTTLLRKSPEGISTQQAVFLLESTASNFSLEEDLDELNKLNKKYSSRFGFKYLPFTKEELSKLKEHGVSFNLKSTLPNHFSSIELRNFRQFKSLSLENFGQFNIILGDNNVGKTSILESLLLDNSLKSYFKSLVYAYWERQNFRDSSPESINSYFLRQTGIHDFSILVKEKRQVWNYTIEKSNDETPNIFLVRALGKPLEIDFLREVEELEKQHEFSFNSFIPFAKGYGKDMARLYLDSIDRHMKVRRSFEKRLKSFIPNLDRVTPDTEKGVIYIDEVGAEEAVPLHQFGEGANKLFRVLLHIQLCKNKRLMIDEIDAGIHFSRFLDFWKIILTAAKECNVQLFITTHNEECIEYFNEAIKEEGMEDIASSSRVVTVFENENEKGTYFSITREASEIDYALEYGFEMRGGKDD